MKNIFDWDLITTHRDKGTKKLKCPVCHDTRKNKSDKSLYVNYNDGVAKCFNCESLSFRCNDDNDYSEKKYTEVENTANSVRDNENILSYIKSRGISEETLSKLYVSFESHYQPAKGKIMDNIVFNYYEGSKLVNKKYRSASKDFTQVAGAKPIFYNINSVIGQDEVYVVEGEFDVLALHEFGVKNVISVPNGANDNDEYWKNSERHLKHIKKFIIAVDNDEKGNELKERIAQRLGRYRCEYIEWKNKDANGDLMAGEIHHSLNNRKRFPVNGTFTVSDLEGGIMDLYDNGLPDTLYPKDRCFKGIKYCFTVMRGQLTVCTGIPSHGKSNFTDWYVLNLIKDYNMKASWFSPEHSPMQLYHTNLMQKVIGKNFWKEKNGIERVTKKDINSYRDWADERIYLTGVTDGEFPTWNWLFDKFKEQMFSFGIDIFVIDAFNKLILPKGMSKLDAINEVLTKLTSFAQMNNVLIFLVAHPTKMQRLEDGTYTMPTLYDVSGSADFRNQTHNGYTIYRHWDNEVTGENGYTKFVNMKTKYNFQGQIGEFVNFKYCDVNGRFYTGDEEPYYSFLENDIEQQELPKIEADEAFDKDEEIPF